MMYDDCLGQICGKTKSVHLWCDRLSDRSFMVDPLGYFSFQPVFHDWLNKGCGMCYHVYLCGMMHVNSAAV